MIEGPSFELPEREIIQLIFRRARRVRDVITGGYFLWMSIKSLVSYLQVMQKLNIMMHHEP